MAERRMFAKTIIDSDLFLDMPSSTQCLYFHLSMRADDDGFIGNPRRIQKMIGSSDDDMKLLIAKQFIIPFESGIVVIKHWKIHNYIQKDRYKPTVYQEEKAMLSVKGNSEYSPLQSPLDTECIQNVSNLDTQVRLGKDRLVEDSLGKASQGNILDVEAESAPKYDYEAVKETYNSFCTNLPSCRMITDKRKSAIRTFLKDFTLEQWQEICQKANKSQFLTGGGDRGWKADIDFLLKIDKAAKILEGGYSKEEKKSGPPDDGLYYGVYV